MKLYVRLFGSTEDRTVLDAIQRVLDTARMSHAGELSGAAGGTEASTVPHTEAEGKPLDTYAQVLTFVLAKLLAARSDIPSTRLSGTAGRNRAPVPARPEAQSVGPWPACADQPRSPAAACSAGRSPSRPNEASATDSGSPRLRASSRPSRR